MFTKPAGFSSSFSAAALSDKHQEQQNAIYQNAKDEIQELMMRLPPWTLAAPPLDDMHRLKDRITKKGFSFTVEKGLDTSQSSIGEWDYSGSTTTIKIDLPQTPLAEEDDGYFSDGWNPRLKASVVRSKMQALLTKEYQSLAKEIESHLNANPGCREYRFNFINGKSPIVLNWIEEELKERKFIVTRDSGIVQADASGTFGGCYQNLVCINPKSSNYRSIPINIY